jgi:hypothetical protein
LGFIFTIRVLLNKVDKFYVIKNSFVVNFYLIKKTMIEKSNDNNKQNSNFVMRVSPEEIKVQNLLNLLKKKNIHIERFYFQDVRQDLKQWTAQGFHPSQWAYIEVAADYDDLRVILKSSDEFRGYINRIVSVLE